VKDRKEWSWRFPARGASKEDVSRKLTEALEHIINYDEDVVLGFPSTTPLEEALKAYEDAFKAYAMFAGRNPNNIGVHTNEARSESGFAGTQDLEKSVILALGDLAGADDPERQIEGYLTSGGSESNDHAIWMGDTKLKRAEALHRGTVLWTSHLTHYSVQKHYHRLMENSMWHARAEIKNVMEVLPTNEYGELTPEIIRHEFQRFVKNNFRRFLIILNAGTITMGSVDRIDEICATIAEIKADFGTQDPIHTYVHVDGAYGGLVLPFWEPKFQFGFGNELVDSVSLDMHKMGYVPYPAGAFLCRKGYLQEYTLTEAAYLKDHKDYTVNGSRPGATAAACWAAINTLGREGYEQRLETCRKTLGYLQDQLKSLDETGEDVFLYPARLNIQAVRFSPRFQEAIRHAEDHRGEPFHIPTHELPLHLTLMPRIAISMSGSCTVRRFIVTPTVTNETIDVFISALRAALAA
jgi:tyrosine decarboxylase / aspartate 1-decarboxylase